MAVQETPGGLLASAIDLTRFVAVFQSTDGRPVPIGRETIRPMTSEVGCPQADLPAPANTGYGLGWFIGTDNRGRILIHHTGHLPGTAAFMGWRSDGIGAAVLFNCDQAAQNAMLIQIFLEGLAEAVDGIFSRPNDDIFPKFSP